MYPNLFKSLCVLFVLFFSTTAYAQDMVAKKVLSNSIEIRMPQDFKSVTSTSDITEAYANEKATASIGFTITEMPIPDQVVPQIGKQMEEQLTAKYKPEKIIGSENLQVNGKNIYTLAFIANGGTTYSRIALFIANGKLVVGKFDCSAAQQTEWEKKLDAMIRSIKDVK